MSSAPYIARARRLLRISQAELGDRLDVTREHIVRLESGDKDPSAELLERLAELVAKRLVSRLVRSARTERKEIGDAARLSDGEFVKELKRQARPLMRLLAYATVAGEAVAMEKRAWCALLATTHRVLRGVRSSAVKNGVAVYPAAEVGLALEAAVRGQSYRDFVASRSPRDPPPLKQFWIAVGMDRLGAELELRAAALDFTFTSGVLRSELVARIAELERERRQIST